MSALAGPLLDVPSTPVRAAGELIGDAPASPAGPIDADEAAALPRPPEVTLPRAVQVLCFGQCQTSYVFRNRARYGEVFDVLGHRLE